MRKGPIHAAVLAVPMAGMLFVAIASSAGAAAFSPMTAPEYQFLAELNAARVANGQPALVANGVLSGLARERSDQMLATGRFSHYDPSGNLVFAGLLNAVGFPYAFAGENLAENNYAWGQSMEVASGQLMNSPTHRDNILNPRFNEAGIGIAGPGPKGEFYYTQLFAEAV